MLRVLLGKRNVPAIKCPACRAPCFTVQHKSQQALNLSLAGHELQKNPRKPDGFLCQIAATRVNAKHVVPADSEGSVDSFQHGIEPLRQIALLRNFKLDTTIADFCLRAKEPLAHSLRWDKEGMSNTTRIQTQNRLQHKRRVHGGIDRRVSAHEEQFQPFIWKFGGQIRLRGVFLQECERRLAR